MYLKKHILFFLVILHVVKLSADTIPKNDIVVELPEKIQLQIDSGKIETLSPSKESEVKLFADPKLKYANSVADRKGIFERFLEWLAEKLFGNAGFDNVVTARKIIIWSVSLLAPGILIWLLSRSELVSLVRAKPKATAFNFMDVAEDLDKINFEEKIKSALHEGDYRLAVRWHYLKILFLLDKAKFIEFAAFKTNIDYRYELKSKQHQHAFIRLSYVYEHVWYGQFVIGITDYKEKETEFNNFEKGLGV